MAGVAQPQYEHVRFRGPFGAMALRQYAALLEMRWRMTVNSVRSVHGAFEFSARGVALIIYSIMGLGLGFGLGAGSFELVSHGRFYLLPTVFWTVFLVWQVLPIALASFQDQFDLGAILRFPVGFGSFYLLNLVFGIVDVPAILGGICCLGIWGGVTLAQPRLFGWTGFVLFIYAVFNILFARAVLAWVDRWLAKRRSREIVSAVFLLLMLSLQLLNPALRHNVAEERGSGADASEQKMLNEAKPLVHAGQRAQFWLPPGLASRAIARALSNRRLPAFESAGLLGLFIFATGVVLAVRLQAEYSGERLSEAPERQKITESDRRWLLDGSGPVFAVMEKELRVIPRSMPLLFAMGAPLLTVLVISTVMRNAAPGGRPFALAFPLCVCYALLGFTQMIFNNLGAEGTGIQMLFLSPTPIRTILLAKNLLHGMLFCVVAVLAGIFAAFRLGLPSGVLIATTAAWVLFALPANLAAGDVLSLTLPYRVNLGRLSRQRGSQASALISMLIQAFVMGVGVAVYELCAHFEKRWLAVPCLLVLAGGAAAGWMRILSNADSLANRNRDDLIATLAKTE